MRGPSPPVPHLDGRIERGNAKRQAILDRAVDLASVEGLAGLTIGRLATDLGISKSGVLLHFGSKEELQLATVGAAVRRFVDHVIEPANLAPTGLGRLLKLCYAWFDHVERPIFPGGCFFSAVAAEFDTRPGRIRDAIAAAHREWLRLLETQAAIAVEEGELLDVDPARLAFELDAMARNANLVHLLHDDRQAFRQAREAIRDRLLALTPGDRASAPRPGSTRGRARRKS